MSTPERLSTVRHSELEDGSSKPPNEHLSAQRRPAPRRTERRWEIGFFIRKIVKGWLAFYKKFPQLTRSGRPSSALQARSLETAEESEGTERSSPTLQPLSGHAMGDDDPGPVGETSVETGFFLRSTTDDDGDGT